MRCFGDGDPLYERYHDEEWGRPVDDDAGVFERLCLEGFQSGLSWITVLRKRDSFRRAFHDFDPDRVARMDERDVERLLTDTGIIRNRAKIEATISNARALSDLRASGRTLSGLMWAYAPRDEAAPIDFSALAPFSDAAKALSKELKKLGFRFVGPTTTYAAFQAIGVVNDHLAGCDVRQEVERQRASFLRAREDDAVP